MLMVMILLWLALGRRCFLWWIFLLFFVRAVGLVIRVVAAIWPRLVLADPLAMILLVVVVFAAPGVLAEKPLVLALSLVVEGDARLRDWMLLLLPWVTELLA